MNYLSAFLMIKDENEYLKEWLYFHLAQGFTKFYIYDNLSKTPVSETLSKEISEGLVDVTFWGETKEGRHHMAMDHFLNRKDVDTFWASLTDTDEFAFGVEDKLPTVLKRYEGWQSVKLLWNCFGSSGHKSKPTGLVIESYLKRGSQEDLEGGKSIVKFGLVKNMRDCHNARANYKTKIIPQSEAILNHYVTRSEEEWVNKKARGGGNGSSRPFRLFKVFESKTNKHADEKILKYLEETKIKMGLEAPPNKKWK